MIEIFAIASTCLAGAGWLYHTHRIELLRHRAEQAERQRDIYKKWWGELSKQWHSDRQALDDALDSSDRQASALDAYRNRIERIAAQETANANATVRRIIKIARGEA